MDASRIMLSDALRKGFSCLLVGGGVLAVLFALAMGGMMCGRMREADTRIDIVGTSGRMSMPTGATGVVIRGSMADYYFCGSATNDSFRAWCREREMTDDGQASPSDFVLDPSRLQGNWTADDLSRALSDPTMGADVRGFERWKKRQTGGGGWIAYYDGKSGRFYGFLGGW